MAAPGEGPFGDVSVEERVLDVDGVLVASVHARPDGIPRAGVVLHPDVGGLRPLFTDLARRLATHGLAVWAVEPFASVPTVLAAGVEARLGAIRELDDDRQLAILAAAADRLVVDDDVVRVGVVGFCMGGHYAFKAATTERFDVAVAFYGMLRTPDAWAGPGHRIEPLAGAAAMVPTLAIFGSVDPWTPAADIEALRAAWAERTDCEILEFADADHGFMHDPDRPAHRPAEAAAAWSRALGVLAP
ncbi:MAG: dienelactone hydrolase family protein [Actinomycetota bacterium]